MSPDLAALADIRQSIRRVETFSSALDYDAFLHDERARWAIYSQVLIIGEAASRVSRGFQERHKAVPWRKAISMRHRLIHGYDEIDWEIVWKTVMDDLPKLKAAIEPMIPEEPD